MSCTPKTELSFGHRLGATTIWLLIALTGASISPVVGAEALVPLGSAGSFAVLAGSGISNRGTTIVIGNVGVSPGTNTTGLSNLMVNGTVHVADLTAATAQTNLMMAFTNAAGRTNPVALAGDAGGLTLTPGLYQSTASLDVSSGDLTLDAEGKPASVFIFQIASNFTVDPSRQIVLTGGARAGNVFWQVGDSAVLGADAVVKGNILANQAITIGSRASFDGRALARMGPVTLDRNVITIPQIGTTNAPPVDVFTLTPIALNPQSGLFEQTIRASHVGPDTNFVLGLAVSIRGLPRDVTVYNASTHDLAGTPLVTYSLRLFGGSSVDFLIEYYRGNRQSFTQPNFAAAGALVFPGSRPAERIIAVDRTVRLENGRFFIEFAAIPGKAYAIEYSSNLVNWIAANPAIIAPADRVHWFDDGPPKTESAPVGLGSRFYRVLELP